MPPLSEIAGRYEIRAELGRGTMGVVYRAHDRDLGRDVALKVIRSTVEDADGAEGNYEQRFLNEARAAGRLSHPAIVVVHDVGRDAASGALFMALELLRGRTLQEVLREEGRLPWAEAARLVVRVAEGLHHAHEHGIVHRDVKPANIMVLASGEPKVMDFGIAKVEASQLTAAGQLFGTPLYMSPEQARAGPVDGRSDLFSLGSVLYELLTGHRAFSSDSVHGIVLQVVQSDPPPPSSVVAEIPRDLDRVVARCLAKDPRRRHADGRELATDLRAVLSGAPLAVPAPEAPADGAATMVSSRPPAPSPAATRPGPGKPPGQEKRSALAGARGKLLLAAAALAVAVSAAYLARGRPVPEEAPPPASTPGGETAPPPASTLDRVTSILTGPEPAQVTLDFGHSLKSGTLRVFVDDEVVIEEDLDSRVTKRIAGLTLRKGALLESFSVTPGRHEIRVRVAWEGKVKDESTWASFKPGSQRRLEARLRGVGGLQDLSLRWR
ncbi:MAG TPA: protein kinase [Vicinamibacteria bacterium]